MLSLRVPAEAPRGLEALRSRGSHGKWVGEAKRGTIWIEIAQDALVLCCFNQEAFRDGPRRFKRAPICHKVGPETPQGAPHERPKIIPKEVLLAPRWLHDSPGWSKTSPRLFIMAPYCLLGAPEPPQGGRMAPRKPRGYLKTAPKASKMRPRWLRIGIDCRTCSQKGTFKQH